MHYRTSQIFAGYFEDELHGAGHYQSVVPTRDSEILQVFKEGGGVDVADMLHLPRDLPDSVRVRRQDETETLVETTTSPLASTVAPDEAEADLTASINAEADLTASTVAPAPFTSLPAPDYQQNMDITAELNAPDITKAREAEIAILNATNQEWEKNKNDDKPLTEKEKKKLEKGRMMIWQYVSKKLLSDPVFLDKVKKKKGTDNFKEKADKCAVRIGLKLEKAGFSETKLWLMLEDNEKGILGFHNELWAAVINETIETDLDARKSKDRLDAELLKDGTVFKYIGQFIQANPTLGKDVPLSPLMPDKQKRKRPRSPGLEEMMGEVFGPLTPIKVRRLDADIWRRSSPITPPPPLSLQITPPPVTPSPSPPRRITRARAAKKKNFID